MKNFHSELQWPLKIICYPFPTNIWYAFNRERIMKDSGGSEFKWCIRVNDGRECWDGGQRYIHTYMRIQLDHGLWGHVIIANRVLLEPCKLNGSWAGAVGLEIMHMWWFSEQGNSIGNSKPRSWSRWVKRRGEIRSVTKLVPSHSLETRVTPLNCYSN